MIIRWLGGGLGTTTHMHSPPGEGNGVLLLTNIYQVSTVDGVLGT